MRSRVGSNLVSLGLVASLVACGGSDPKPKKAEAAAGKAEVAATKVDTPATKPKPEPFVAKPKAAPPPAPKGAIAIPDPWRYVQVCDEQHPCPELLQTEGELHCRSFGLSVLKSGWRLPSKSEMGAWGKTEGLEQVEGYHWTRTPYEDDPMQAWIVDPSGKAQATTIPRKRKPFRVRCVYEP
jgi:hypothetical protein